MARSSLQRLAASIGLVFALAASGARAQSTQPAMQDGAASPNTSADGDHRIFCRDHWFAVGQCHDVDRTALPRVMLGVDFGAAHMVESGPVGFDNGIGSVTNTGPAWGARAGVDVLTWLGFEARYVGSYTSAQASVSPTGKVGYLMTGGEAVARFTAPLPYVHVYAFGGVGYYDVQLVGSSSAKAGSVLFSSSQPGIALGVGLEVPLTWHVSLGAEAGYHFMLGESYSNDMTNGIDGGDVTTFTGVLRVRL